MTRHYTRINEHAASAAVAALPSLNFSEGSDITEDTVPALPAEATVSVTVASLQDLAARLKPENLEEIRMRMIELAESAG